MADRVIENPIINSPYSPPSRHFAFDNDGITSEIVESQRPSSYFVPVPRPRKRGQQMELDFAELTGSQLRENDFVNQVRRRVEQWRLEGRMHVTYTTRRLLDYWTDESRDNPILFCQLEAAETAIFLAEAAPRMGDVWIRNKLAEENVERYLAENRSVLPLTEYSEQQVQVHVAPGITVDGRIDLIRRLDTNETSIVDFKSSSRAQAEDITRDQLHVYAVGYQELTGQRADLLEVLNLDPGGVSTREMVNDDLLGGIKDKIHDAGQDLRANRLPRLSRWCQTCDRCDLAGLCRSHP